MGIKRTQENQGNVKGNDTQPGMSGFKKLGNSGKSSDNPEKSIPYPEDFQNPQDSLQNHKRICLKNHIELEKLEKKQVQKMSLWDASYVLRLEGEGCEQANFLKICKNRNERANSREHPPPQPRAKKWKFHPCFIWLQRTIQYLITRANNHT